jgi:hypothetical protein
MKQITARPKSYVLQTLQPSFERAHFFAKDTLHCDNSIRVVTWLDRSATLTETEEQINRTKIAGIKRYGREKVPADFFVLFHGKACRLESLAQPFLNAASGKFNAPTKTNLRAGCFSILTESETEYLRKSCNYSQFITVQKAQKTPSPKKRKHPIHDIHQDHSEFDALRVAISLFGPRTMFFANENGHDPYLPPVNSMVFFLGDPHLKAAWHSGQVTKSNRGVLSLDVFPK